MKTIPRVQTHCYLCGKPLDDGRLLSDDHVVPRQLIAREQPRARGFDYGGTIKTHAICNNGFGPESMGTKAMDVLRVLHDPACHSVHRSPSDPGITFTAIDSSQANLSDADLDFFGISDARHDDTSIIGSRGYFASKRPGNPVFRATQVGLSVLTKSAAALLVHRYLPGVPNVWRVLAAAKIADTPLVSFQEILGEQLPFDTGVDVHVKPLLEQKGDWFVAYTARHFIVFFYFCFSGNEDVTNEIASVIADGGDLFLWEGTAISELKTLPWRVIKAD